jgi:hypothetical protein
MLWSVLLIISALALPAGIDSKPQDQTGCAFTANLGSPPASATTGTLSTRLFRGGGQGSCGQNPFPGNSGSGSFPFDAYTFTNPSASPVCVAVALTVNAQTNANYQIAAFQAPFAASDISNASRYLGDPGVSSNTPPQNPLTFQFTVPANTSFALVIFSVNGTTELGGSYSFTVSSPGFCSPSLPALYGASAIGQLFTIDPTTGAGTFVGTLPFGAQGGSTEIVFNNATRRAWTQFSPSAFVGGEEFDITTGAGIGNPIGTAGAFNGLEWVGSTLYGTMITGFGGQSQLRTLDPFAGTSNMVGSTGIGPIAGLAYDQTGGTLYGITGGNGSGGGAFGNLVTINLTTGAATVVGPVGFNAGSLEFGPDGNLYAGSTDGLGNLYRIDKATGAGTLIGQTGFNNVTGLTLVNSTNTIQFTAANYNVGEADQFANVTVTRTGDTSSTASVNYATSDSAGSQNCNVTNGIASSRCDYISALGTLRFAAGETSKTMSILIVNDKYVEGPETFNLTLSNPNGASLGSPATATVTINDDDVSPGANPIDQAGFFVTEHYYDFLNRLPDADGLAFWTNEITSCGTDQNCIGLKRINVSAAYFLSIEFQQTGYLVERMYKAAFGSASGASTLGGVHQLPVPIVRFNEFLPDTQQIGQGVVVNVGNWQQQLENNKQAFALDFVQRARFTSAFATTLTPAQFVDALFTNAGVTPSPADRNAAIAEFGSATTTTDTAARGRTLRDVAENATLQQQEFNRAFVLMQFFGYLRRNPNDPQDTDYTGYEFWLTKLNQFNGDFVAAEMVKAFITSTEYRQRFGP